MNDEKKITLICECGTTHIIPINYYLRQAQNEVIEKIEIFVKEGLEANGGWLYCCEELNQLLNTLKEA